MLKHGSWYLYSKSDSRWNANGEGLVGMFSMPYECQQKLEELRKKHGESPEDLEWSYLKH